MTLNLNPKGNTVAKNPINKNNTVKRKKTATKTKAPMKRSEFGKTIHHYMIDHDQTLQNVAHGHF